MRARTPGNRSPGMTYMETRKLTRAPTMSFIVRVWNDGDGKPAMRGEIEHVTTGEKRLFFDYASMLSVIDTWRQDLDGQP